MDGLVRVAVCVKPVPEDPARGPAGAAAPDRSGRLVLDGADAAGVELALRLAEGTATGGEVTAVAMAPAHGASALRSALAMGADRAVLVSDPALEGTDALGTARVLAAVVGRAPFHVIVAGTESADGSTGLLAPQLAELLGMPAVTFARAAVLHEGGELVRVERQTVDGWDEIECPVPCVLSAAGAGGRPRYPSVGGIFGAAAKPWERLDVAGLGLAPASVGWAGAATLVVGAAPPPARGRPEVVDDGGAGHRRILDFLHGLGVVPR